MMVIKKKQIVTVAMALLLVLAVETVYFMTLQGKETGCNADELELANS